MSSKIVLVGGGHSHVQVLESLQQQPLSGTEVTVVVDRPIAVYSGMVPGFVAGQYEARQLEIDVPALCAWAGVDCIVRPMTRIDAASRQILLADDTRLDYDLASLNIGSTVAGLDLPGVRDFAVPTRPIARLIERTEQVVQAARSRDPERPFRTIVVGGGAGGIELAFTFRERLARSGRERLQVDIVNAGARILEGYSLGLARRAERAASRRGIDIHCRCRVQEATAERVLLDNGEEWYYDALLWVTGAASHGILHASGLATESRGFALTRSTLQVDGYDDLFAVGDCATLIEYPETPKAGVYAVRQGPVLAENLRAMLAGESLRVYRPQTDFLTLLNLGDGTALGTKKGLSFEGRWVMTLKDWIDRRFMKRFQKTPSRPAIGDVA